MKRILTIFAALAIALGANAQYVPSEGNMKNRAIVANERLGIFIHWGVYSMLGQGEWVMHNKNINWEEYAHLAKGFDPKSFNADEWVAAFKDAEAGYMTITSRHHDGFSMWHTEQSDYNIVDYSPFGRDVIKEISEACARQNFRLHLYYSHLDWRRSDYFPLGRTGHGTGRPEGDENSWQHYLDFMDAQLTELLTNYGPIGCIWFDGVWDKNEGHREDVDSTWHVVHQYELIHSIQPDCLVANNHHMQPFDGEDLQIFERDIPGQNTSGFNDGATPQDLIPMETCETMNKTWGYNITDTNYKSVADVVTLLVKAAAKGGNLLINIGPRPDGTLPDQAKAILKGLGEWMRAYGNETVKGTVGGFAEEEAWGVQTAKGKTIYLHVLNSTDTITLPYAMKKVRSVRTFEGAPVKYAKGQDSIVISVPEREEGVFDQILAVTLK